MIYWLHSFIFYGSLTFQQLALHWISIEPFLYQSLAEIHNA